MTRDLLAHERLTMVFRESFDDPALVIKDEYDATSVPGWDSLMHINLIVGIEEEFGISFSTAEIAGFKNIGEVKSVILQRATL